MKRIATPVPIAFTGCVSKPAEPEMIQQPVKLAIKIGITQMFRSCSVY